MSTQRLYSQLKSYRFLLHNPIKLNTLIAHLRLELVLKLKSPSSTLKFEGWIKNFRSGMKIMGSYIFKECSPIFAQRLFRSYRVLQLHSKLWSNSLSGGRPVSTNKALLSFLIFSLCHPNSPNKITDFIQHQELVEHMKDLDFIHDLTAATVVCEKCRNRLIVDKKVPNVKYCHCADSKSAYDKKVEGFSWTPFVETADLLIWRMPHPDRPGLYMYKVFGYYDDISPEDFLETQLDVEYRRKWDDTVLKLEIVESSREDNLDLIYWEMKWPTMFSNRDYLFARRYLVDEEKKTMVIMSKAVPHASAPDRKGVHRVKEYWSVMQVKAVKGLSQPGVEFGLTYFDNPGVSLPGWLNNWAAMTAIPEFLDKQRNAARAKRKGKPSIYTKSYSPLSSSDPTKSGDNIKPNNDNETDGSDNGSDSSNPTSINSSPKNEILSHFIKEHVVQRH